MNISFDGSKCKSAVHLCTLYGHLHCSQFYNLIDENVYNVAKIRENYMINLKEKLTINNKWRLKNPSGYSFSSIRLSNWLQSLAVNYVYCSRTLTSVQLSRKVAFFCCTHAVIIP